MGIFIHGLGDTGHGWADAVEQMKRSRNRLDEVKFILPHAPTIPITMNGGFPMPGWFDIKALGYSVDSLGAKSVDEDRPGILRSQEYFHGLIQEEINAGIPSERIILGGFSWLLLSQGFKDLVPASNINESTPVLMGHGDMDPLVRFPLAQDSEKALKDLGYDVTMKVYRGMEHSACLEELSEIEAFLAKQLPAKGKTEL